MDGKALLRGVLCLALSLLYASEALGGTIDPNTPDSKYLEFGEQFPFVLKLCANDPAHVKSNTAANYCGSCVLIKPRWAITAAHIVQKTTAPRVLFNGKRVPVAHVILPDNYIEKNYGFHDVALCYLAAPIELEFYPELYEHNDELGKAVTIAGFGLHGTFLTGAKHNDSRRRAGHNKLEILSRNVALAKPDKVARFPLEFCTASGDSGGGMFIGNKLAGISSYIADNDGSADGSYGDECAFTRVSLYRAWILEQIAEYEQKLVR